MRVGMTAVGKRIPGVTRSVWVAPFEEELGRKGSEFSPRDLGELFSRDSKFPKRSLLLSDLLWRPLARHEPRPWSGTSLPQFADDAKVGRALVNHGVRGFHSIRASDRPDVRPSLVQRLKVTKIECAEFERVQGPADSTVRVR